MLTEGVRPGRILRGPRDGVICPMSPSADAGQSHTSSTVTTRLAKHYYEFGHFRLDPTERLLIRRGTRLRLTPKVFDTLLALVENSGHVLKKEELLRRVWPDTVVEENNLNKNVSKLRKILGESRHEPSSIETVPKLGYRFVAEVTERWEETEVWRSEPPVPSEGGTADLGQPFAGELRLDLRLQDTTTGEVMVQLAEIGNGTNLFDLVSRAGERLRTKLGVASETIRGG